MSESAVDRTPIEIWIEILRCAIWSPLDSIQSQDILQSMEILWLEAQPSKLHPLHLRIEQIRTKLRLVCRDWDAIISSSIGHSTAALIIMIRSRVGNILTTFWPSRQAYESAPWIQIISACPSFKNLYLSPGGSEGVVGQDITCPASADIVLSTSNQEINVMKFLESCPETLKVLRSSLGDPHYPTFRSIQRFQQLTHLCLDCVGLIPEATLSLPELRVLWLHGHRPYVSAKGEWNFPKLQHLRLEGETMNDITADITRLSSSVWTDTKVWGTFPHLKSLGLPFKAAISPNTQLRPLVGPGKPFRLILTRFIEDFESSGFNSGKRYAISILNLVQSSVWRVDRLVFDASWNQLANLPKNESSVLRLLALSMLRLIVDTFNYLQDNYIEIYDRNGAGYQDADGRAFFDGIRGYEESLTLRGKALVDNELHTEHFRIG